MKPFACRNCRRPLHWVDGAGWLHGELPQYAHEPIACDSAHPSCMYRSCDHSNGPNPNCPCGCHEPGGQSPATDCAKHKGHRRWVGGIKDGHVDHLIHAAPSDYPQTWGSMLQDGQRSWYEIDHNASQGREAVYRLVGLGRDLTETEGRESRD